MKHFLKFFCTFSCVQASCQKHVKMTIKKTTVELFDRSTRDLKEKKTPTKQHNFQ